MLCALTVRHLKPGAAEEFERTFAPDEETEAPRGWKRFYAIRNLADENEVVTFGFFDGSLEEMRANQDENDYAARREAAEEYVESTATDGVFEVVEERLAS